MTVSSLTRTVTWTGDGLTYAYTFPFKIYAATDLYVYAYTVITDPTVLTLNSDYTVTINDTTDGGHIDLDPDEFGPLLAGSSLVIERILPLTQETVYIEGDSFPAKSHEDALDRLIMIAQQLSARIGALE